MKIDLHLHTQSLKNGESKKRNIEPNDFVTQMIENKIGMMAITNHNKFDLEEYNDIIEIKPDLKLFPGIELDVMNDEKHYHIIVVSNPIVKNKFYHVFDGELDRNYDKYSITYEEFIGKVKKMSPDDIVIIPHFANKDRAIGYDFLEGPKTDLKEYVTILEPSGLQTMGMVNAHGHLSLIGSDLEDWETYKDEAIPELKFHIETFEKFHELCKDSDSFIKKAIENTTRFNIDHNGLKNLHIYHDLNVVFGEKGSGKTILLKRHLTPYFNNIGKKTYFHEGKEYSTLYDNLIKEKVDGVKVDSKEKNKVETLVKKHLEYSETSIDFIKMYREYHESLTKSKNRKKLEKADSQYSSTETNSYTEIIKIFSEDIANIDAVLLIDERLDREELRSEMLAEELKHLKTDLKDILKMQYKSIYIKDNVTKFLNNIKTSADKNTGSKSKPLTIGFEKLVSKRMQLLEDNIALRNSLETFKLEKVERLGELPGKGNVNLAIKIDVMNKDSVATDGFNRSKIVVNRVLISKLIGFSVENLRGINSYFTTNERDTDVSDFIENIILKTHKVTTKLNDNYVPSEGEQAILSVSGILESYNYDVYIFDELERGLGNKYITEYVIPKINDLVHAGKTVIVSTHNANLSINSMPISFVYCDFIDESQEIYYEGNMFDNKLKGITTGVLKKWDAKALKHLEGSNEMFKRRKNIYGL